MSEQKEPKKISPALKKFFGVGDFGFTCQTSADILRSYTSLLPCSGNTIRRLIGSFVSP